MALGNLILDETGQVMGMRVLSNNAAVVSVEVSLPPGGNGIMTTQDGDVISLIGNGSGKAAPPGAPTNFRTMLHPHTASPKYADLNGTAWAGEYDVNPDGSAVNKCWEWK